MPLDGNEEEEDDDADEEEDATDVAAADNDGDDDDDDDDGAEIIMVATRELDSTVWVAIFLCEKWPTTSSTSSKSESWELLKDRLSQEDCIVKFSC